MRKSLSIAVLALVVLSACSKTPTKEISTKDGDTRLGVGSPVKVTIENDPDQQSVRYLWVDQEPIHARKGRRDDIVWMIQAPGYQFTTGGIKILGTFQGPAQPLGPPPADFRCSRDPNPKKFTCTNTNSTPGLFKYAIEVEDPTTGTRLMVDPTIKNQ